MCDVVGTLGIVLHTRIYIYAVKDIYLQREADCLYNVSLIVFQQKGYQTQGKPEWTVWPDISEGAANSSPDVTALSASH
jgi:hypothetical protein